MRYSWGSLQRVHHSCLGTTQRVQCSWLGTMQRVLVVKYVTEIVGGSWSLHVCRQRVCMRVLGVVVVVIDIYNLYIGWR